MLTITFLADVPKSFMVHAVPLGCSANLSWNTPSVGSCPITRYTIYHRKSMTASSDTGAWQTTVLNKPDINQHRLWLNCSKKYDIMAFAWNQRGHSDFNDKSVLSVLTDTGNEFCNDNTKTNDIVTLTKAAKCKYERFEETSRDVDTTTE